jgi:L-arabinose isomerase
MRRAQDASGRAKGEIVMSFDATTLRIALFAIGLDAYWPQFEGLKQRLEGYTAEVAEKLKMGGAELINFGLVDSPQAALRTGHAIRQADADIVFLYATTYALSATVLPVLRHAKLPVIVLNLQPETAIDYASFNRLADRTKMTGEWLAFCSACPVPEIANVLQRAGIPFQQVTGVLHGDPECWREVEEWVAAAQVAKVLSHNRLGLMGHYYNGMLDIVTDFTQVCITFGGHVELLEVDELSHLREEVSVSEVDQRVRLFQEGFDVQPDCDPAELRRSARTSVALDRLVEKNELTSLAYYYKGSGVPANEDTMSSIILGTSLLTARGIPVAGEYEVKNAIAMKIMDSFGAGGSFTEYYAIDFAADQVLMGHDGPGHVAIAEGKTKVRPLRVYHGKVGKGLSVEMSVKYGPVTLLSVAEDRAKGFKLLVAEGASEPGPTLEIGNTNSRYRFPIGARRFVNDWNSQGPAHHCAVGVGHIGNKLEKLAKLLAIDVVRVC